VLQMVGDAARGGLSGAKVAVERGSTLANDHTFFVGAARVLVHNASCPDINPLTGRSHRIAPDTIDLSKEVIAERLAANGARAIFSGGNYAAVEYWDKNGDLAIKVMPSAPIAGPFRA